MSEIRMTIYGRELVFEKEKDTIVSINGWDKLFNRCTLEELVTLCELVLNKLDVDKHYRITSHSKADLQSAVKSTSEKSETPNEDKKETKTLDKSINKTNESFIRRLEDIATGEIKRSPGTYLHTDEFNKLARERGITTNVQMALQLEIEYSRLNLYTRQDKQKSPLPKYLAVKIAKLLSVPESRFTFIIT